MRTIFSKEILAKLRQNLCVFSCTERSINYTSEFKKRALELHAQGMSAKDIWKQADIRVVFMREHEKLYFIAIGSHSELYE